MAQPDIIQIDQDNSAATVANAGEIIIHSGGDSVEGTYRKVSATQYDELISGLELSLSSGVWTLGDGGTSLYTYTVATAGNSAIPIGTGWVVGVDGTGATPVSTWNPGQPSTINLT